MNQLRPLDAHATLLRETLAHPIMDLSQVISVSAAQNATDYAVRHHTSKAQDQHMSDLKYLLYVLEAHRDLFAKDASRNTESEFDFTRGFNKGFQVEAESATRMFDHVILDIQKKIAALNATRDSK